MGKNHGVYFVLLAFMEVNFLGHIWLQCFFYCAKITLFSTMCMYAMLSLPYVIERQVRKYCPHLPPSNILLS